MNERQFKQKIRTSLKRFVHIQAIQSASETGTPDLWVSGSMSDLWIEVKYDSRTKGAVTPHLTPRQQQWIDTQHKLGRNVCVIVGLPEQLCIIYVNGTWINPSRNKIPYSEMIEWVKSQVMEGR